MPSRFGEFSLVEVAELLTAPLSQPPIISPMTAKRSILSALANLLSGTNMALLILGKTVCSICTRVIQDGQDVMSFPPFVMNELDPLWVFNDAAFHANCFYRHPLAGKALARLDDFMSHTGANWRLCMLCNNEIENPDDYVTFGHLVDNESHPLFPYNYARFHRLCLSRWPELPYISQHLDELAQSGTFKGKGIDWLVSQVRLMLRQKLQ